MRNKLSIKFSFFPLILFLLQYNCLYNPIVRQILELDPKKKEDEIWKLLPFLNLSPNFEARITPSLGNVIKSNTQIQVVFNHSIDITNFSAELGSSLTSVWSQTNVPNDTVILTGILPLGNQTFLLNAVDTSGNRMETVSGRFIVLNLNTNIYYLSATGNDGNLGTGPGSPKLTLSPTIALATVPAAILVSAGDYLVTGPTITLVEGVSLYGGHSQDFMNRDPNTIISRIVDTSTLPIGNSHAVSADFTITQATEIDGFTIQGASNPNATVQSAALFILGGSPTIRNNRVLAGNVNTITTISIAILVGSSSALITENPMISGASGAGTFGIFLDNSATPTISNNTIHGGSASGSAHAIYNNPSANAPNIFGNSVYGGSGAISYGLNNSTPSNPTLTNNTIDGGIGNTSRAIYQGAVGGNVGTYVGNRLFTSGGTNRFCLFEAGSVSPISFNNNQLTNCPTALYYDQGATPIFDLGTINGGTTGGATYTGNF